MTESSERQKRSRFNDETSVRASGKVEERPSLRRNKNRGALKGRREGISTTKQSSRSPERLKIRRLYDKTRVEDPIKVEEKSPLRRNKSRGTWKGRREAVSTPKQESRSLERQKRSYLYDETSVADPAKVEQNFLYHETSSGSKYKNKNVQLCLYKDVQN